MNRTLRISRFPARSRIALALATAFAAQAVFAAPPTPTTLPTGGNVVAGQASINQAGAAMTINQASSQAILNWQSFSIGSGASVNFVQPGASAVALNRVLGSDPSAIYGSLTANGQVFLVNPNGVLFGPGARVDVGGLVASTLNIRDADFLARNYRFSRDGAVGTVVNAGDLKGQYVALLAPEVRNEGVIVASMGTVALAAGDAVTLGISGQRLVDVQVDKASVNTLVENRHLIRAEEGTVILSAQSAHTLLGRVVNSSAVEANGISTDGGTVRLLASSTIDHSGSISANGSANGSGGSVILLADLANPASRTTVSGSITARGGNVSGDGGFIETSAHRLSIADSARIDAGATNGRSGLWLLDPFDFTIAPNGDISGTALSTALDTGIAGTNVTITAANANVSCVGAACAAGNAAGNGDIHVNQEVSWTKGSTLTLSAFRDVNINSPITSTDATGKLALEYNQGDGGGTYRVFAPVTLAAGNNFSTKDGSAGALTTYAVFTSRAGLLGIAGDLTGKYALGADIDLDPGGTGDWVPLGNGGGGFTGTFEGLRHKLTNLNMSTESATYVGLFGAVDAGGAVRNVGVETGVAGIKGAQFVGVVAGKNAGKISASYSKGLITGSTNGADTVLAIGGLVGQNDGEITESYSAVKVVATGGIQTTGNGTDGGIGGLVGVQGAGATQIYASYATGDVDGLKDVGGLVGFHQVGSIKAVQARGKVNNGVGDPNTGGLVGFSMLSDQIIDGYWDTTTSMQNDGIGTGSPPPIIPGPPLVGNATADMKKQATFVGGGNYDFNSTTGNWVIYEDVTYALLRTFLTPLIVHADNKTAAYNGAAAAGVGFTSTNSIAAPVGANLTGAVSFGGAAAAAVNAGPNVGGIVPNVVQPTSFPAAGTSGLAPNDKTDQHGYLLYAANGNLTITPKAVNLTAPAATKVYNGNTAYTASAGDLAALSAMLGVGGDTVTGITLTYDTAAAGAGNKTLTPSLATVSSAAGNYNITFVPIATASITPKPVTLTPQAATKVFDGTTNYTATAGDLAVLSAQLGVGGETVTAITLTFNSAAVGTNKTLTPSAAVVSTANGNYNITFADNATSSITAVVAPPAPPAPTTTTTPAADPAVQTRTTLPVASGNFLVTFVPPHSVDSADTELVDAGTGQTVRSVRLALPGNAVSGKSSVIPPGGLIAMLRTASRSDNSLSSAPQYTQASREGTYPVLVPANSDSSNARISVDENVPAAEVVAGRPMSAKLPDSTFQHTRADAVVTLVANGLPEWATFDAATGTISGTPPAGFSGPVAVTVTARDNFGNAVDATISIEAGSGAAAGRGRMRATMGGTGAAPARAEIRATATGGSRRDSIGTGRVGGDAAGGGRLGTGTRATGGRLGAGGRLGTGAVPGRGGSAGTGGESDRRQR
jgi:filamentous hemagglutinin family protein